jgi:hypothetical protein
VRKLLDNLNSGGGHIVVLIFLICLSLFCMQIGIAKAGDILVGALAALWPLVSSRRGLNLDPKKQPIRSAGTHPLKSDAPAERGKEKVSR